MVTRIEKSSKNRNEKNYKLLWRVAKHLGWSIVNLAVEGDEHALRVVDNFAWKGRKRPALVRWVEEQRKSARATEVSKVLRKRKARC